MRFCGGFRRFPAPLRPGKAAEGAPRGARGRPLRPPRGRRRRPPWSTSRPASRSASTASTAAPAGGDDVLDEADALALLVDPLEPVGGAVLLRLLADDQERQARRERGGRRERDRAELRPGDAASRRARARRSPRRAARRAAAAGRAASRSGTCRGSSASGVPSGARSRPRGRRARGARRELGVVHPPRAAASAARASGSRRAASGAPFESDCIEPSSK